jgi:glycosyltransferase involved in cell wall biosynthesis
VFHTFLDLEPFAAPVQPLPRPPRLLFVGVLERYKNVDSLVAAWRLAAPRLPGVVLHVVGSGRERPLVERLVAELPAQTEWSPRLEREEVAAALDAATALVLPSRSEGLPRVGMEALVRGRPIVGARGGGIPDLVRDGENGLLVPVEDSRALADALVRVASDSALAERLAAGAARSREHWLAEAAAYPDRVAEVVGGLSSIALR